MSSNGSFLSKYKIDSEVVESKGQFGGGALPGSEINSFAVKLKVKNNTSRQRSEFVESLYKGLLQQSIPVLAILRKGDIYFDVLTMPEQELELALKSISNVYKQISG